jgi:TetR/AcrR family transcriptional repressor of nem operon
MMVKTTSKGAQTRQRIVELAAPVFNRQGYVGASMRDITTATGMEKGGIYNHFGSKEQLALESYDFAMSIVTGALARSQNGASDAIDRLTRLIRTFSVSARNPVIEGGCPIMNTAIESDDGHVELRDRARYSMTQWHRLIGRIVKDGKAAGTVRADVDPYALASLLTGSLEGGLMLARLYDDPAHMDHVVDHLVDHVETLRISSGTSTTKETMQ